MLIYINRLKQGTTFLYGDELYMVEVKKESIKEVKTMCLNNGNIAYFGYDIIVEPVNIEIRITKAETEITKVFGI